MKRLIGGPILLLPVLVLAGCNNDLPTAAIRGDTNPTLSDPADFSPLVSPTELTWKRAYRFQQAVHAYAGDNGGVFPALLNSRNIMGRNVIDYLPDGQRMPNAFTKYRTEPVGGGAYSPGQIGYTSVNAGGNIVGYIIEAMGRNTSESLVLNFYPTVSAENSNDFRAGS